MSVARDKANGRSAIVLQLTPEVKGGYVPVCFRIWYK